MPASPARDPHIFIHAWRNCWIFRSEKLLFFRVSVVNIALRIFFHLPSPLAELDGRLFASKNDDEFYASCKMKNFYKEEEI